MTTVVQRVTTPAGDPAWLVTGYENVRQLLSDLRLGKTHPDPGSAARFTESVILGQARQAAPTEREDHARMRRMLARSFSARRLAGLRPRVQHLVDDRLEELADRTPPTDFHEAVSFPLPALVICELLGVPFEDRNDFRHWSDEAAVTSDHDRSTAGLEALFRYIGGLVARKMDDPAEDVLSDLIAVHREDPDTFPLDQVSGLGAGLLFAGHETTVAAIDRGVVLLLTHPAQREALQRDPDLVPAAVEEILRNLAPWPRPETEAIRGLSRWANTELAVGGVTIPAGDLVLLDVQDANHDEQIFDGSAVFDVSRADNPHMTFGHGRFFCAGAALARMELQALFATLFTRFPTLRLAVPAEDLQARKFRLVGGITELPVTW